jgi:hypothetical protein
MKEIPNSIGKAQPEETNTEAAYQLFLAYCQLPQQKMQGRT